MIFNVIILALTLGLCAVGTETIIYFNRNQNKTVEEIRKPLLIRIDIVIGLIIVLGVITIVKIVLGK